MQEPEKGSQFVRAGESGRENIAVQFVRFLSENKKWWLLPIVVVLLALGVLILVGGSGAGPFIYTLF